MFHRHPRHRKRRIVIAAVTTGLVGALASCSVGSTTAQPDDSDTADMGVYADLYQEALDEGGVVTWYTAFIPDNMEVIEPAFEEQFPGVDMQALRLVGAEMPIRFRSEVEAGATSADIITTSETGFSKEAMENGWTDEVASFDLPTYADFPEEFVGDGQFVTQIAPVRVSYNAELVTDPPETWQDLLEPEFKDQMMLVDPRSIVAWLAQYNLLYEEFGAEYLESLSAQDYRLVDSAIPASQAMVAGEGLAVFPSLDSVANPMKAEGAPIENTALAPYTGVQNSTMISTKAEHPAAARLLAAWLMSEEGQTAVNAGFAASPLSGLDGVDSVGDGYVAYDEDAVNANRDAILGALGIQ